MVCGSHGRPEGQTGEEEEVEEEEEVGVSVTFLLRRPWDGGRDRDLASDTVPCGPLIAGEPACLSHTPD